MIYINHEKKAIFIHIPKTAGSYISKILVKYYGFNSYLHVISKRRPDHSTICNNINFPIILTGNNLYDNSYFNKCVGLLYYCKTSDHINEECNMNEEKWNTYFKFCFVRHPYYRALSAWKHINNILPNILPFDDYICQNKFNTSDIEYGHFFMSQSQYITDINGNCGVNMIGRFEHLEEDLKLILNKIGFKIIFHKLDNNLKKINTLHEYNEINSNKLVLSKKSILILNYLFDDDFNNFNYKKAKINNNTKL